MIASFSHEVAVSQQAIRSSPVRLSVGEHGQAVDLQVSTPVYRFLAHAVEAGGLDEPLESRARHRSRAIVIRNIPSLIRKLAKIRVMNESDTVPAQLGGKLIDVGFDDILFGVYERIHAEHKVNRIVSYCCQRLAIVDVVLDM
jgi:hypothetical protein